jgi:alpha-1,3/alpha-1,6-mannosyltransferase
LWLVVDVFDSRVDENMMTLVALIDRAKVASLSYLIVSPSSRTTIPPFNMTIVPVEAMSSGLPVLACNSGGPTESIVDNPPTERTGWLRAPETSGWAAALIEIARLAPSERSTLADRARARAREHFGMEAMAVKLERALIEAANMGPVLAPATIWFGSFFAVALFAYFMATIYGS